MRETEVMYYTNLFKSEMKTNRPKIDILKQDLDFYYAIHNGQWTPTAVHTMEQQKRPIITWNIIMKHIDAEAGMLLQNPFEFSFDTEYGQNPSDAQLFNELRLRDKDYGKWQIQKTLFTINFLVNHGILELFVDYSKDKLGALNFRSRNLLNFNFDSNWESQDVDDNKQIFNWSYMYPDEMLRTFGKTADKLDEIKEAVDRFILNRGQEVKTFEDRHWSSAFLPLVRKGQYLVFQMQELEHKREKILYNYDTGQFIEDIEPDDFESMIQLHEMGGQRVEAIDNPNSKQCNVKAFSPALSLNTMLADGPHPLQVGGYPLIVSSPKHKDGERIGRVSQYKDPQTVYNKKIANYLHWEMTRSLGNTFVGPNSFGDPREKQRYIDERNIPGGVYDVNDPDQITKEKIEQPPNDLYKGVEHVQQFMDMIGVPLANRAIPQFSGTSGKLFDAQREQGAIADEPIADLLEAVENKAGELYFKGAKYHYSDGVPRVWRSKTEGKDIIANTDESNDISRISRLSIRITQQPVGTTIKRENLSIAYKLRQQTKDPLEDALLAIQMVDLIPGMDEDARRKMKEVLELSLEAAKVQKMAVIQQMGGGGPTPNQIPETGSDNTIPQQTGNIGAAS